MSPFMIEAEHLTKRFGELTVVDDLSFRVNEGEIFGLLALPFGGLYVLGEIQAITLDAPTLLVISGILGLVDILLFFVSRATFRREQILTKWK
jgi:ABC-2 type transport system permease protein